MKKVTIIKFECETCGKMFDSKADCEWHEKYYHKCPTCKHVWYLYGAEQECELKRCCYSPKEKND